MGNLGDMGAPYGSGNSPGKPKWGGATPWKCRRCCRDQKIAYRHPSSPDATCLSCDAPLSDVQRLTEVVLVMTTVLASAGAPQVRFIGAREAADVLGVTVEALYARVERGEMTEVVHRIGRSLRFSSDGLVRWMAQGRARRR
jgi:excisionase family DNA binding protein